MSGSRKPIGATIAEARARKGMTQAELAAEAGTTQQTIGRIETGAVTHSRALRRVLSALELPDPRGADALTSARIAAGFGTATDAARAFGWTVSTYLGHENGSRGLSVDSAKAYACAFGVPWPTLLSDDHEKITVQRNWLVVTDQGIFGDTRYMVPAHDLQFQDGALIFGDGEGGCVAAFAAGSWTTVLESTPSNPEPAGVSRTPLDDVDGAIQ